MEKIITLEIDSDPFARAQEPLAKTIFNDILEQEYREPNSTFFGNWTWEKVACTEKQREKIIALLSDSYDQGLIRYASWAEQ